MKEHRRFFLPFPFAALSRENGDPERPQTLRIPEI